MLTVVKRAVSRFGLIASTLVLLATVSFAQAPPSADTFASSATPAVNYGGFPTLVVSPGITSYVQFNLSGMPTNAIVGKATLRLYVDAVVKPGSFDVYQLNNAWKENTLTFSTAPPLGPSATGGHTVAVAAATCNQFVLIDITNLAQGWANGSIPNNGIALALVAGSSGSFSFDSKESLLTGNGPELQLVLASQGPQGPKGDPGPPGVPGVDGAIGPQGPQGPQGQGFSFKSAFDPAAAYSAYDVVTFNGSSYVAKAANHTGDPTPDLNPNWSLMAQQGAQGLQGMQGSQGIQGPKGDTGPQGIQGVQGIQGLTGSPGVNGNSILPAFLPGPLTTAYTAASIVPDAPITVTRISAALKTPPDPKCPPTVLRVGDGNTAQDVDLLAGQSLKDTGPMTLPLSTSAALKVDLARPANCPQANPADANVIVQYRAQQPGDTQTCAASGLVCNGICEETQNDLKNCGACGNSCATGSNSASACVSGTCSFACNQGFTHCNPNSGDCVDLTTDLNNCGTCGKVCTPLGGLSTTTCDGGTCTSICQDHTDECGGSCLPEYDPRNCGGGCVTCPTGTNGSSICTLCDTADCAEVGYFCSTFTCNPGFTMCSSACVDLNSDVTNCGACGNTCRALQICSSGVCTLPIAR